MKLEAAGTKDLGKHVGACTGAVPSEIMRTCGFIYCKLQFLLLSRCKLKFVSEAECCTPFLVCYETSRDSGLFAGAKMLVAGGPCGPGQPSHHGSPRTRLCGWLPQ